MGADHEFRSGSFPTWPSTLGFVLSRLEPRKDRIGETWTEARPPHWAARRAPESRYRARVILNDERLRDIQGLLHGWTAAPVSDTASTRLFRLVSASIRRTSTGGNVSLHLVELDFEGRDIRQ
jgi:hypothetical protein